MFPTGPEDILDAVRSAEKQRHVAATKCNERSSRSHTILRLLIESSPASEEEEGIKKAELNLVTQGAPACSYFSS